MAKRQIEKIISVLTISEFISHNGNMSFLLFIKKSVFLNFVFCYCYSHIINFVCVDTRPLIKTFQCK